MMCFCMMGYVFKKNDAAEVGLKLTLIMWFVMKIFEDGINAIMSSYRHKNDDK